MSFADKDSEIEPSLEAFSNDEPVDRKSRTIKLKSSHVKELIENFENRSDVSSNADAEFD